jgi:hypothetical protein
MEKPARVKRLLRVTDFLVTEDLVKDLTFFQWIALWFNMKKIQKTQIDKNGDGN